MFGPTITATLDKGKGPINLELGVIKDEKEAARRYTAWFAETRVRFYLTLAYPFVLSAEEDWIRKTCANPDEIHWAIYADGNHIGCISLMSIDRLHSKAELGIVIGDRHYWGKGIGTVAEMLVVEWAFSNCVAGGLHKVTARVLGGNEISKKALKTVGFIDAGIHRQDHWARGRWFDVWFGDILQAEWCASRDDKMKSVGVTSYDLYPGCDDIELASG